MRNGPFGNEWDGNAEIECMECHSVSIPKYDRWGSKPNLCDECVTKGWISDTDPEFYKTISADPVLVKHVSVQSPYL